MSTEPKAFSHKSKYESENILFAMLSQTISDRFRRIATSHRGSSAQGGCSLLGKSEGGERPIFFTRPRCSGYAHVMASVAAVVEESATCNLCLRYNTVASSARCKLDEKPSSGSERMDFSINTLFAHGRQPPPELFESALWMQRTVIPRGYR